jgi:hypothetical protein
MNFPWFGIGSALVAALGGYGLLWYHNLSKAEQEEADRLAVNYARQLYSKSLDQLTSHQLDRVHELVKGRFAA